MRRHIDVIIILICIALMFLLGVNYGKHLVIRKLPDVVGKRLNDKNSSDIRKIDTIYLPPKTSVLAIKKSDTQKVQETLSKAMIKITPYIDTVSMALTKQRIGYEKKNDSQDNREIHRKVVVDVDTLNLYKFKVDSLTLTNSKYKSQLTTLVLAPTKKDTIYIKTSDSVKIYAHEDYSRLFGLKTGITNSYTVVDVGKERYTLNHQAPFYGLKGQVGIVTDFNTIRVGTGIRYDWRKYSILVGMYYDPFNKRFVPITVARYDFRLF